MLATRFDFERHDFRAERYGDKAQAAMRAGNDTAARLYELLAAHAGWLYYRGLLAACNGNRGRQAGAMRGLNRAAGELRRAWKEYCKEELTAKAAALMLRGHS